MLIIYTRPQWRNSALIIGGGGGGTTFRRGADNFGGIQATISHHSKFGGGGLSPRPPGNCAYARPVII